MPEFLLIFLFIVTLFFIFFVFIPGIFEDKDYIVPLTIMFLVFCLPIDIWFIKYLNTPYQYNEHEVTVYKINSIDIVEINGKIINLNEQFKKSFEDGQKIIIRIPNTEILYYGVKLSNSSKNKMKLINTLSE